MKKTRIIISLCLLLPLSTVSSFALPSWLIQDAPTATHTLEAIKMAMRTQMSRVSEGRLDAIARHAEDTESLWLAATGDLMFHSPQVNAAYVAESDTYDFTSTFEAVKPYLSCADITFGNFESTTAGRDRGFSGYPAFNAPDETLDAIQWAGYDLLSTANNHCLDRGISGAERTITQMRSRELLQTGTFLQSEPEAPRYTILEVNGIKLGVLAATYGCNGIEKSINSNVLSQAVNLIDEAKLEADLEAMDAAGVDQSIVFIHWGNEYQRTPAAVQTELAQKLVDWGADIILGSHPHVIQSSEILYKDGEPKYVIYSMGNFISNQSRSTLSSISNAKYTENGVIVYLKLEKTASGTRLAAVKHVPTWVYKSRENGITHYEILPIEKQTSYEETSAVYAYTEDAYAATMSMMTPNASF